MPNCVLDGGVQAVAEGMSDLGGIWMVESLHERARSAAEAKHVSSGPPQTRTNTPGAQPSQHSHENARRHFVRTRLPGWARAPLSSFLFFFSFFSHQHFRNFQTQHAFHRFRHLQGEEFPYV